MHRSPSRSQRAACLLRALLLLLGPMGPLPHPCCGWDGGGRSRAGSSPAVARSQVPAPFRICAEAA